MVTDSPISNLISRLRQRLITVPNPDAKPFDLPVGGYFQMGSVGGTHKPGDSAGVLSVSGTCGNKMQEHIYAVDPLCEEAAQALERIPDAVTITVTPNEQEPTVPLKVYNALKVDRDDWRDQAVRWEAEEKKRQAELAKWKANCTGKHGSQMSCVESLPEEPADERGCKLEDGACDCTVAEVAKCLASENGTGDV